MNEAIGLIEIVGLASAIKVADTMLKAANVSFKDMQKTKGLGWMVITVEGDVGAVNAAISSGEAEAKQIGKYVSSKVIPRPANGLSDIFVNEPLESNKQKAAPEKPTPKNEGTKKETPEKSEPKKPVTKAEPKKPAAQAKSEPKKSAPKAENKAKSTSTNEEKAQADAN